MDRTRLNRRRLVQAAAGGAAAGALGRRTGARAQDKTKLVWSTWGAPEELTRFEEFNAAFMERHPEIELELVPVPSYEEYHPKLLTQIGAGQGPDVMFVGDDNIGKFVTGGALMDITDMLSGEASQSRPDDFYPGLWGAARSPEGRYFGVTNDCNPQMLWINRTVLADAGITDDPVAMQAAGTWTWDAFLAMCAKITAAGKTGAVLENWFADTYSIISAFGGKIYGEDGAWAASTDANSVAALTAIHANVANGNFTCSNFLPEGQGAGAMFVSGLTGFRSAGRWFLPRLKDEMDHAAFDVVTWPTTGGAPQPCGIATSFLGINAKTPHADAAFTFLTEFVSRDGQIFRLKDGGNAVPSIKGADEVVSEGDLPANNAALITARDTGFVEPAEETRVPGLPQDILKGLEPLWLGQGDPAAAITALGETVAKALSGA